MAGFEPGSSRVGIDRSVNCASTTWSNISKFCALVCLFVLKHRKRDLFVEREIIINLRTEVKEEIGKRNLRYSGNF